MHAVTSPLSFSMRLLSYIGNEKDATPTQIGLINKMRGWVDCSIRGSVYHLGSQGQVTRISAMKHHCMLRFDSSYINLFSSCNLCRMTSISGNWKILSSLLKKELARVESSLMCAFPRVALIDASWVYASTTTSWRPTSTCGCKLAWLDGLSTSLVFRRRFSVASMA